MSTWNLILPFLLGFIFVTSALSFDFKERRKRANTVGEALGNRGNKAPPKRKPPGKVIPPLTLGPGETPVQPPGWKHCIKNVRANLLWRSFKSPGYPDFLESQIQCSWIIEAPIGMKVKVAFRDLDMIGTSGSCAKQFVQIVDVKTGKSQGRFCGSTRPGDYVTAGTRLRLDLQADKAVTKVRGFLISYTAVKEISGFRTTKTFPSMYQGGGEGAPGKVDIKSFISNSNKNLPKAAPGSKRASKRLVYESDRNPLVTDPTGTSTQPGDSNRLGSDTDFGWIGPDEDINTSNGPRRPSSGPLKVSGTRRRPASSQPMIFTTSILPVRIRAKNPTPAQTEDPTDGPVIYGHSHQPHDPSLYSTEFPVRLHRVEDNRPETLSTTNIIVIAVSGACFLFIVTFALVFWWCYRNRKLKKKRKERAEKRKREQNQREAGGLEMNVMSLGDDEEIKMDEMERQRMNRELPLPGVRSLPEDPPPRYQRHREYSRPPDGDMEQLHGQQLRGAPRNASRAQGDRTRHNQRHEMPNHIQLRHSEERNREMLRHDLGHPGQARPYHSGMARNRSEHDLHLRHQGRQFSHGSPPRVRHQTLDPRFLQGNRDPTMNGGYMGPRRPPFVYNKKGSRPPPNDVTKGRQSRNENVDEDYCSGGSDTSGSGKAPMRREYSTWELEQMKNEKRKKLINGEI